MKSNLSVCQIECSFCSVSEKYEKFSMRVPSFNCSSFQGRLLFLYFLGCRDTHHCSSSPYFPLNPHSDMTNFFHFVIQTATPSPHPTYYFTFPPFSFLSAQQSTHRQKSVAVSMNLCALFISQKCLEKISSSFCSPEKWTDSLLSQNLFFSLHYDLLSHLCYVTSSLFLKTLASRSNPVLP